MTEERVEMIHGVHREIPRECLGGPRRSFRSALGVRVDLEQDRSAVGCASLLIVTVTGDVKPLERRGEGNQGVESSSERPAVPAARRTTRSGPSHGSARLVWAQSPGAAMGRGVEGVEEAGMPAEDCENAEGEILRVLEGFEVIGDEGLAELTLEGLKGVS